MENHYHLTDLEFEKQFSSCQLNPADFSHEAHLRLAWIHIDQYGIAQAEKNVVEQLQRFVVHVGAEDKFNITLTLAAIKAVYHFKVKSTATSFKDFILEFPRLKYNFKELMACHYAVDIYHSKRAKKRFIAPDLLPFE